jgi:hypothetical protein
VAVVHRAFQRAGRQKLRDQVTDSGGPRLWAKRLGCPYPERKPGCAPRWTDQRVRAELEQLLRGWDCWPSRLEFEAAGHKALRDAVRRLEGSARWAAEFRLPLQNLKSGSNLVWTDERIEAQLRSVLDGRDAWPTRRQLELVGRSGLAIAVAQYGGSAYWARRLGFEVPPRAEMRPPSLDRRAHPKRIGGVLPGPNHLADRARVSRRGQVEALQTPLATTAGHRTGPPGWGTFRQGELDHRRVPNGSPQTTWAGKYRHRHQPKPRARPRATRDLPEPRLASAGQSKAEPEEQR